MLLLECNIPLKVIKLFEAFQQRCKTITSIKNGFNKEINEALDIEALAFKDTFLNSESKIGLNSFLNKEKPKF